MFLYRIATAVCLYSREQYCADGIICSTCLSWISYPAGRMRAEEVMRMNAKFTLPPNFCTRPLTTRAHSVRRLAQKWPFFAGASRYGAAHLLVYVDATVRNISPCPVSSARVPAELFHSSIPALQRAFNRILWILRQSVIDGGACEKVVVAAFFRVIHATDFI